MSTIGVFPWVRLANLIEVGGFQLLPFERHRWPAGPGGRSTPGQPANLVGTGGHGCAVHVDQNPCLQGVANRSASILTVSAVSDERANCRTARLGRCPAPHLRRDHGSMANVVPATASLGGRDERRPRRGGTRQRRRSGGEHGEAHAVGSEGSCRRDRESGARRVKGPRRSARVGCQRGRRAANARRVHRRPHRRPVAIEVPR